MENKLSVIKENVVTFGVSTYSCSNPQKLFEDIFPKNCIKSLWKGSAIANSVSMWFEFSNQQDKQEYMEIIRNSGIKWDVSWVVGDMEKEAYAKDIMKDGNEISDFFWDNYSDIWVDETTPAL